MNERPTLAEVEAALERASAVVWAPTGELLASRSVSRTQAEPWAEIPGQLGAADAGSSAPVEATPKSPLRFEAGRAFLKTLHLGISSAEKMDGGTLILNRFRRLRTSRDEPRGEWTMR